MLEKTLSIVKPDAVERNLEDKIQEILVKNHDWNFFLFFSTYPNNEDLRSIMMSHFVLNVELRISNQCKLIFFFFIENILSIFLQSLKNLGLLILSPSLHLSKFKGSLLC